MRLANSLKFQGFFTIDVFGLIAFLIVPELQRGVFILLKVAETFTFDMISENKVYKTLRVTPAMEAKLTKKVMTLEEVCNLVAEPISKKRGAYNKNK